MTDAALDALAEELFDRYAERNPVFATFVGVHAYDHLLPKGTLEAVREETRMAKSFLKRVEALDTKSLSPGKRVDRGVLRQTLRQWVFETEELRIWESRPSGAEDVADALFPLFMRTFAPLEKRMESITGRLERAPSYLEETKTRVRKPTKLWVEMGIESAQQVPAFLGLIGSAGKGALPAADAARLAEAVAKANEAIADHERWIREDLKPKAVDRVGIGAANLRRLISLRELGLSVDAIYAIGERYLRESRRELTRLARQIKPGASVQEAKELVKSDHPADWNAALEATGKAMADAKRFVMEHRIATLPPNEVLHVVETRSYLRHVIPFAAYNVPAHFDPLQEGFYMLTFHPDQPEMLKEAYYAGIRNTAVHEGYPGHHLQFSCANLNPSFARIFGNATETIEGWAHYCEQMMKERGFGDDPATRFAQMLDQVWRACRILIDVDLHRGRMSFDEAVDMLVHVAGMERPGAVAEVKRYSYTPAYALSYLIGKYLILQLRKDVKKGLGSQYTEKFFHDTYLYAGSIPLTYMRMLFEYKVRELQKLRKKGL